MALLAEAAPAELPGPSIRQGRTVYCVSEASHFPGLVALVNSLRLTGWRDEIVLVDCGLEDRQRELLAQEVDVIPAPPVEAPHLLKAVGPLERPAEAIVVLDADIIVTRSLDPLIDDALENKRFLVYADVLHDRRDARWGSILGLDELRDQTYANSGFLVAPAELGLRVLRRLQEAQTRIDLDRSMVGHGTPEDPFYFPDQDALNAILASDVVRPEEVGVLDHALAPHPPFRGVRIVDANRLRVVRDDGSEPFALHHIQRKPWLAPLDSTPYSQLLPRLWFADDLPLRLQPGDVPLRFRGAWTGRVAARYASASRSAERARVNARRRLAAQSKPSERLPRSVERDGLWVRTHELAAKAPTRADLRSHRLESFEIRRFRRLGIPVPAELAEHELFAVASSRSAERLLQAARDAYDGRIALIKGYELALRYPEPWLRPFSDVDLLVDDSEVAQRALLAAGFVEVGEPSVFKDIHHLRPLWIPGSTLVIELHHDVKWPDGIAPPPARELLDMAVPSRSGVDGIVTLPDELHAVVLAMHSWTHLPFRSLLDLVDIAALDAGADRSLQAGLADTYGVGRIWQTTRAVVDEVLLGGFRTAVGLVWGRHLMTARERMVFESHLERWLSPVSAYPLRTAAAAIGSRLVDEVRPGQDESWNDKRARIAHALRNAATRRSEHDSQLGAAAHRRRRR
jgi:hypothetical protein